MPTPISGFWFSLADASGDRITGSEVQLSPAPADVEYPTEFLGSVTATAQGAQISQQPTQDSRLRHWVWHNLPVNHIAVRRMWGQLLSLRAKTRFAGGQSPFVYLLDAESGGFLRRVDEAYVIGTSGASTLTLTGATFTTDALRGGAIEVMTGTGAGQLRPLNTNTSNTVTLLDPFTVTPDVGATVRVRYESPEWVKCRVLDVARRVAQGKGTVIFDEARLTFIPSDTFLNSW